MASVFNEMLSYWFFFLSRCVMGTSLFLSTGPAAGGGRVYPPERPTRMAGISCPDWE